MIRYYIIVFALVQSFFVHAQQQAYKNKTLSPDARAKDLIGKMTTDEKLMQLQCFWSQKSTVIDKNGVFDPAKAEKVLKNGLGEFARLNENAGPNSLGYHPKQAAVLYNTIQRFFIEKIRVNTKMHVLGFQFTQAELISSLLLLSGLVLWFYLRKRNAPVTS